jgi:cob(I)alamin adenosyltransferase
MGYLYYKTANEQRLRAQIESMEDYISTHNNSIPPMFVNPRGAVNLARAICRRAERRVVEFAEIERLLPMSERYMNLDPVIKYFNRLSDYLFVKSFERASDQPQLFRDEMEQQIPLAVAA